uniref:Glycoside hydrolase family 5 n=1 Tax=uncultured bacterium contig00030 TaxID=1181519 RepID=A0A806KM42_9BACT|nr:glycoside hydrolase family 5 [uncultured bacterium contig00030]
MNKRYLFNVLTVLVLVFSLFFITCKDKENENGDENLEEYPLTADFNDVTAAALVSGIKIGWNLGNTFDAHSGTSYRGTTVTVQSLETQWVGSVTTKANIDTLKNAGFNAIRIPVSWHQVADPGNDYTIRADWMARIKEVVDYAMANDMYIFLNTHHDESIIKFNTTAELDASKVVLEKLWKQIAAAFRDYNEKLIFEGLNEPRTKGSGAEWNGGTDGERTNLNALNQVFVSTVRATSGNNAKRILMIPTYAASVEQAAVSALKIPNDPGNTNKIIVSLHSYSPYNFALNTDKAYNTWSATNSSDTSAITGWMTRAKTTFIDKGIPVVIGEFGAMNKDNEAARAAWGEYYVSQARSRGIPCVWWDNGVTTGGGELFGLLNRKDNTFTYPVLLQGLMKGAQ